MIALAARQSALAGLDARELLGFAVKRFNQPAAVVFLFGSGRVVLC